MAKVGLPDVIIHWQREMYGVSDDMFHLVADHYKVSEKKLKENVKIFRDWYRMQPHFPKPDIDERSAYRYLAMNKFKIEKSKERLENMLSAKNLMPELFSNRDPWNPEVSKILDSFQWIAVPKNMADFTRLFIIRMNPNEVNSFSPMAVVSICLMMVDLGLYLDVNVGSNIVCDMTYLTFSQAVKVSPVLLKKIMFLVEKCYALHIKGIHFVNLPGFAEFLVTAMKTIANKKHADRIFIHKSMEDLFKVVPKAFIPKDLGGDYPTTSKELSDKMKKMLNSPQMRDWFVESLNYKTDETKRLKPSETKVDDLFGVLGTFKKLDID